MIIDCKSCGMSYDEKEYSMCPYCGHEPVKESEKIEVKSRKQEEKSKDIAEPEVVRVRASGNSIKYILIGLAILVAIAAAVYIFVDFGDSGVTVPDKYATIQEAIDAAEDGDEIIVQIGVYRENIDFKGKNIILRSTDPSDPSIVAETIIDGRDSGTVVSFRSGEGEGAILDGFTVTRGSGILISGGSSPVIQNCIIEDNTAEYGAGVAIFDSAPSILNNIITNNSGFLGGGIFIEESSPLVDGNEISRNRAEMGSGIVIISNSAPMVTNNIIADNVATRLGGGLVVALSSTPTIRGNTITGNVAERNGGGVLIEESEPVIEDNTISRNRAANGGGFFVVNSLNSALQVIGNNIANNLAYIAGGGFYMEGSSPTLDGNSFIDNISEYLGGGLAIYNSSPVILRNIFESNQAGIPEGGGAIWVSEDSILELNENDSNTYTLNLPNDIFWE
ncbi:MAG: right-handed parallel beta-helix repeat-containing protein [Bacillota bacterium]|nr:right-handed parallel beta-helix repeat-containing protein [Bacillota bacterium]